MQATCTHTDAAARGPQASLRQAPLTALTPPWQAKQQPTPTSALEENGSSSGRPVKGLTLGGVVQGVGIRRLAHKVEFIHAQPPQLRRESRHRRLA